MSEGPTTKGRNRTRLINLDPQPNDQFLGRTDPVFGSRGTCGILESRMGGGPEGR